MRCSQPSPLTARTTRHFWKRSGPCARDVDSRRTSLIAEHLRAMDGHRGGVLRLRRSDQPRTGAPRPLAYFAPSVCQPSATTPARDRNAVPGRSLPSWAGAEDTRFELVRGCPQPAFQLWWRLTGSFTCVHGRPVVGAATIRLSLMSSAGWERGRGCMRYRAATPYPPVGEAGAADGSQPSVAAGRLPTPGTRYPTNDQEVNR
jgi:hypothetical protein